jgi:hypothetical protein
MHNIPANKRGRKKLIPEFPPAIAYIDTLHFFIKWLPKQDRTALLQRYGNRIRILPCRYGYGCKVLVNHQLSAALAQELDRLHGVASRVDVAYDWSADSAAEADERQAFLKRHHLLRYRRKGRLQHFDNCDAFASVKYTKGTRPRAKNLMVYSDRPSKITGEVHCTHLELRLLTAKGCQRAGIHSCKDVLTINPANLMQRYLSLATHPKMRSSDSIAAFHGRHPCYRLKQIPLSILQLPDMLSVQSTLSPITQPVNLSPFHRNNSTVLPTPT